MPDYSKGKIYKIVNTENDKVYIGSTIMTLAQRIAQHRYDAKTNRSKLYKAMRWHGVENFKIKLIKDYPCESKKQLEDQEFKIIKKYIRMEIKLYNMTTIKGKMCEKIRLKMVGKVGTASARFNRGCVSFSSGNKPSWRFKWRENGKQISKTFSSNKFGYDEAKRLAEEYRDKIYPIE